MIGAGILAALAVLALGVFIYTFDINNYKGAISRLVAEKTGRTVTFGGDIAMTLFPRLGVRMADISLSNASGFGQPQMLSARQARLEVRILPLLSGRVSFGHLALDGVVVGLERDATGRTNWGDLTDRVTSDPPAPDQGGAAGGAQSGQDTGSFVLEIAGVSLTESTLIWDDRRSGVSVTLDNVSLTTGTIGGAEPFPVTAQCGVRSVDPELSGTVEFSASTVVDSAVISLSEIVLTAKAEGKDVPGSSATVEVAADAVSVDMRGQTVRVDGLVVSGYQAAIRLAGSLTGFGAGGRLAATVGLDPFDARQSLAALGLDVPSTSDPSALTRVQGTADVVVDADGFEIRGLDATVDDTRISGSFAHRVREDRPDNVVRLALDTLDLDRYLAANGPDNAAKSAAASPGADMLIDTEVLRALSLDLEASAKSLRAGGVRLSDVQAVVKARHGLVRVSPVKATLYGGTLAAGATINVIGDRPKSDLIIGLDRVDVGGLSRDALGSDEYQGLLTFNGAVACEGARRDAMLRTMSGRTSFALANGVFPGVDLLGMARTTHASRSRTDGTVEAAKTDSTAFGSITGTGVITNGVLNNRDLEIMAPGLRAEGQGAVFLPTGALDYLIKAKLVATAQGQGGKTSSDLYGVLVPIRVTGTLAEPVYRVSLTEYAKALGGAVLDTAGSVIGTAGSVIGGVTGVIKDVGKAFVGGDNNATDTNGQEKKRGFFGLF
ncbi:MAG: AsmA family protein [Pseudodesulfovibrio sp.]|nr:AsmA family protein [Pseudomonadota bacterium]MBV1764112.1 AsmA family protein [Pseudodesulfovibrio sp.]MCG2731918.1 AsmA family protein [Pseudodesulfovibrio aespoeensis]MBU4244150.1 AsmA family protein [Pseudomonadota bacterium]MBU4377932.1 AsmA family protein [Pseudomonadota bacterium]